MSIGASGRNLSEIIKKAIDDGEITSKEYDQILAVAEADGHIDNQEKQLLSHLQEMISNGTVKRVAG